MFPYNYFPESFPHMFVDYLIANQIEGIRVLEDSDSGSQYVYFPMGQDDLTMLLNDWQTPIVNGRKYWTSLDQTPIPYADAKLQQWLAADPGAVITLPDGRVGIDYAIASKWGKENAASGDFVQTFLNGPGPVFALISMGLSITALPAITSALSPATQTPFLDTFDLLPDPTITYNPLSSPINNLPVTDAIEHLSPSYPMPEPSPPPAPVAPGDYVPFEEGFTPDYIPPESPTIPSGVPSPTLPQASNPGALPSLKMPALSDLPKLITTAAGAGLALKTAATRNQLQSDLLKSQAYLPTTSLVPGLFPGDLPFGSSLDPGAEISQTIANFVKSPLFWMGLAAVGIVLVTRK